MAVSFTHIRIGTAYSRSELASLWGYAGMEALARGVVTPRGDRKIILFVTGEKQQGYEQYEDKLVGHTLHWEGPTDHFAEDRILAANRVGEEIHLFYRERHHTTFVYHGRVSLVTSHTRPDRPTSFVFKIFPVDPVKSPSPSRSTSDTA